MSERELLSAIGRQARVAGVVGYLVGGAVRDILLQRRPLDLDVAVDGPLLSAASLVSALGTEKGWTVEARHERFETARLRGPDGTGIDVAATREEQYPFPGALPVVRTGVPILQDLGRRDFTIHAMAFRLSEAGAEPPLLDPYFGQRDLKRRSLRLLHQASLADDPTRAFRGARYAARLGFQMDPGFSEALRLGDQSGSFAKISGDRLRRALHETLSEENRGVAVEILGRLGVFSLVVEGWSVPVTAAREVSGSPGPEEAWAALLAGAPLSLRERIATRLSFSRALRRVTGCPR